MSVKPWEFELPPQLLTSPEAWPDAGVIPASDVGDDDWVRLCPVSDDLIFASLGRKSTDDNGRAAPREIAVDRKLVFGADLVDFGLTPQILASPRLIEALERSRATGWSAALLPHATANPVCGRRLYLLEVSGCIGELVDTKLGEYGLPVPPVTFDATSGTGDDVCWTPWLELASVTRPTWRALLVRGRTLKQLDDPALFVQPVSVRGKPASPNPTPGRVLSAEEPAREPTPLSESLDRLRATAKDHEHVLPAGCPSKQVAEALAAVGAPASSPLRTFLERYNGAVLFDGAIAFNYVGKKPPKGFVRALMFEVEDIVDDNTQSSRESFGVSTPNDVVLFARSLGGRMYWGIDGLGHVTGYSSSGHRYGPDAPFEDWLADTIADLGVVAEQMEAGNRRLSGMLR